MNAIEFNAILCRLFKRLEALGEQAVNLYDKPDCGPRRRDEIKIHTFSAVMCWAACDRLGNHIDKI